MFAFHCFFDSYILHISVFSPSLLCGKQNSIVDPKIHATVYNSRRELQLGRTAISPVVRLHYVVKMEGFLQMELSSLIS
jgi:hypothetical protein